MMLVAAINWHSFLFLLFGGMASLFAICVLVSPNVVRMAFYLIVSLASTAALFFLAGAKFVGAMQIMIYVGGTLVLLVFGVMLTAQASFVSMRTRSSDWVLAAVVAGSLFALLFYVSVSVRDWQIVRADQPELMTDDGEYATSIGAGLLGLRIDQANVVDEVARAGMSGYLLPFEIVSVHLLVVLIGAAYLARTKRKVAARSVVSRVTVQS
jgi:NADH:ubiquinone oxidoreductase subunit 6 (subunit J)